MYYLEYWVKSSNLNTYASNFYITEGSGKRQIDLRGDVTELGGGWYRVRKQIPYKLNEVNVIDHIKAEHYKHCLDMAMAIARKYA